MKESNFIKHVIAALLLSSLLVGCNTFLPQETPTLTPVVSTKMLMPTFTPSDTSTPNPTVTPSPSPTKTATPEPGWVTDFAEPILAAITDRPPDFEEDFTEAGPGWYLEKVNCPDNGCSITDGVLSMAAFPVNFSYAWAEQPYPCCQGFKSFVLRVDVNTAKLNGENSAFITYNDVLRKGGRSTTISEYGFELKSDRRWVSMIGQSGIYGGDNGQLPRSIPPQITFTLISRGSRFAVYLNDIPVTNGEYAGGQNQPEFSLRAYSFGIATASVEYDNLKIWNLDKIPNLP
jgi:hypothetical protein